MEAVNLMQSIVWIFIDKLVILEIKAVGQLVPIHEAQLMTYLKLTGLQVGLLINFNVELLKQGIKRKVISNHP